MITFPEIPRIAALVLFAVLSGPVPASQGAVLRTAAEVTRRLGKPFSDKASFILTAKATAVREKPDGKNPQGRLYALCLEDDSGTTFATLSVTNKISVDDGDIVRAEGRLTLVGTRPLSGASVDRLTKVGHAPPAAPRTATFRTIQNGSLDYRTARISGTVRDASKSDSDHEWVIFKLVMDNDQLLDVSVLSTGESDYHRLLSLIGSAVQIDGIVVPHDRSLRTKMGRIFLCLDNRNVRRISSSSEVPHPIPGISALNGLHPSDIIRKGRHKAVGRVLATWRENNLLMRTTDDEICRIELAEAALPSCGTCIEATGFPESDLYHINLVRANWVKCSATCSTNETPAVQAPEGIVVGKRSHGILNIQRHGCPVYFSGTIQSLPGNNGDGVMYVQNEQTRIAVDISSNPQLIDLLSVGCRIRATGICVIDTPNWTPNALCQKLDHFFLVVRTPDDIEVLSRPSWWTPARLLIAGGILLVLLVAVLIWNRSLIFLAERRGRELLREQIRRIRTNLKVDERTRLAVDLHDALSQNLTGIALQLDLVSRLTGSADSKVARHLGIASRTLQSCRNELRACIWDLRNQALDELSVEDAIRTTLAPHLDAARLSLRFKVPRARLDDNTTHALLRIVRELASNAIRHGQAKTVRIAGTLDGDKLLISIQDDGIGFDPALRPNTKDGHFGLDGISERIRAFNGQMNIASAAGNGTKVIVTLNLPRTEKKETLDHG